MACVVTHACHCGERTQKSARSLKKTMEAEGQSDVKHRL